MPNHSVSVVNDTLLGAKAATVSECDIPTDSALQRPSVAAAAALTHAVLRPQPLPIWPVSAQGNALISVNDKDHSIANLEVAKLDPVQVVDSGPCSVVVPVLGEQTSSKDGRKRGVRMIW